MRTSRGAVRLPWHDDEAIAPVTILDAQGRVVRVVPATELRRAAPVARDHWPERRRRLPRPTAGSTGSEEAGP
jgi:hypothetical protein